MIEYKTGEEFEGVQNPGWMNVVFWMSHEGKVRCLHYNDSVYEPEGCFKKDEFGSVFALNYIFPGEINSYEPIPEHRLSLEEKSIIDALSKGNEFEVMSMRFKLLGGPE